MYLLLILSALFSPLNSIGCKLNKTTSAGKFLSVSVLVCGASIISWIICLIAKQVVTADMFIYALIFALLYLITTLATYLAYEKGSLTITTLFSNSSLVVIILVSTLFFDEKLSPLIIVGIIGTLISLTLLTIPEKTPSKTVSFNFLWLFLCLCVLLGNSSLSLTVKFRQINGGGANAFAFIALCYSFTFVFSILVYAISQLKTRSLPTDFNVLRQNKLSLLLQIVGNSGSNLLVTFLSSRINASILYPVNMGIGLVLTVLCGFIFFKEKPTVKNIAGIVLGVVSLILLNL